MTAFHVVLCTGPFGLATARARLVVAVAQMLVSLTTVPDHAVPGPVATLAGIGA